MELAARVRSFGLDPDGSLVAIALAIEPEDDAGLARRMARIAGRALASRGVYKEVVAVDGSLAIVIASVEADTTLASDLMDALAREGVAASVGVGSQATAGTRGLRRTVAEARLAADYARLRGLPGGIATYADAGSYRVLLAAQSADARSIFARAVLGPILNDGDGARLVETLDAFLRDGGHWQQVAAGLHLHVNTLRYRIGRMEELTGGSLASFEERVNLFIALEALAAAELETRSWRGSSKVIPELRTRYRLQRDAGGDHRVRDVQLTRARSSSSVSPDPRTYARLPYIKDLSGVQCAVFGIPSDGGASFQPARASDPKRSVRHPG